MARDDLLVVRVGVDGALRVPTDAGGALFDTGTVQDGP
jgi:hypothetical protein